MSIDQEIGGKKYRINKLNAFEQLHVVRRLAPLLHSGLFFAGAVGESLRELEKGEDKKSDDAFVEACFSSKPFLIDFSNMPDEELNYIINTTLKHVQRETTAGSYTPVMMNGQLMFDDLNMVELLNIVIKVLDTTIRPILTASGLSDIALAVKEQMSQGG